MSVWTGPHEAGPCLCDLLVTASGRQKRARENKGKHRTEEGRSSQEHAKGLHEVEQRKIFFFFVILVPLDVPICVREIVFQGCQ